MCCVIQTPMRLKKGKLTNVVRQQVVLDDRGAMWSGAE